MHHRSMDGGAGCKTGDVVGFTLPMKAEYSNAVNEALENAPAAVRKAFYRQVGLLVQDLHHPCEARVYGIIMAYADHHRASR